MCCGGISYGGGGTVARQRKGLSNIEYKLFRCPRLWADCRGLMLLHMIPPRGPGPSRSDWCKRVPITGPRRIG